jgi:hypothetical protein
VAERIIGLVSLPGRQHCIASAEEPVLGYPLLNLFDQYEIGTVDINQKSKISERKRTNVL